MEVMTDIFLFLGTTTPCVAFLIDVYGKRRRLKLCYGLLGFSAGCLATCIITTVEMTILSLLN